MEGDVSHILVSSSAYQDLIKGSKKEFTYDWIIIEDIINDASVSSDNESLPTVDLDDIAYVIFTSG
ncbi:hypothetical protein, partial [uncultured Shewanella sp.]|uniref:hypothetical protein n=1 Tax=uncultured Shewanella sp. TaxID=173975 RepID=UPI002620AAE2